MSYLLTNLNKINPFIHNAIKYALTQAGIKTHCDINALHLLNDRSGSDNCPTEDQLRKAAKVLLGYQAASHFNGASFDFAMGHEDTNITGRFLRIGSSLGFNLFASMAVKGIDVAPLYRVIIQYDKIDSAGATANARLFLLHVPRYPNRLECYNEMFNLYISDIANKWDIVLDPNHVYGIKLLDYNTGQPLSKERFERFVAVQNTSCIVRKATNGGRSSKNANNNCHIFELLCDGSGKKIVNFTFHIKDGEPYVTVG